MSAGVEETCRELRGAAGELRSAAAELRVLVGVIRANEGGRVRVAVPEFPTRPDQMPEATVDEMVHNYGEHVGALWIRKVEPDADDEQLAGHALAALATGTAAIDAVADERWHVARDALAYGASLEQVGAAMGGFDVDEVEFYVSRWVEDRHAAGPMGVAEYWHNVDLLAARRREAGPRSGPVRVGRRLLVRRAVRRVVRNVRGAR